MLEISEQKKEPIRYKRDENGQYLCHLCNFTAKYGSTLHYHLKKKHIGNLSHVCTTCGDAFLHKLALETHIASRHPEANQKVEMFHCDCPGCEFESLTRGNLDIHKARKHCSALVNTYLETVEVEKKKYYRCHCCQKDFKSGTAFHYHFVKCLEDNNIQPILTQDS
jgi:hypothetical protein